jgi:hypothetical protein
MRPCGTFSSSNRICHWDVCNSSLTNASHCPRPIRELRPETELYLGLVHRDDMADNAARSSPPGAMSGSTAWPPNAAWRAAIPSVSRRCSQRTLRLPNWTDELLKECRISFVSAPCGLASSFTVDTSSFEGEKRKLTQIVQAADRLVNGEPFLKWKSVYVAR